MYKEGKGLSRIVKIGNGWLRFDIVHWSRMVKEVRKASEGLGSKIVRGVYMFYVGNNPQRLKYTKMCFQ